MKGALCGRGRRPELTDSELMTMAVAQMLQRYDSERRWIRHMMARDVSRHAWSVRLQQAAAELITTVIRVLSADTTLWTDNVWVVDSTPVECGRSKETLKRSDLSGWAEYGYCASHSRYFWCLRLYLVCTLGGLPIGVALTGAKADERQTLLKIFHTDPTLTADRPGQTLVGDKNYFGAEFETSLTEAGLRPACKGELERAGSALIKPLRQTIESINQTFKGQLDLKRHSRHTFSARATTLSKINS